MRWQSLFGDLENQMASQEHVQWNAEVAERTRSEQASLTLAARLAGSKGSAIAVTTADGVRLTGVVTDAAGTWVLLADGPREHLVPMAALQVVEGLASSAAHLGEVERRLGLGHVLRGLARDRARVRVGMAAGEIAGFIATAGADHLEIAREPKGAVVVPFDAITWVTRLPG